MRYLIFLVCLLGFTACSESSNERSAAGNTNAVADTAGEPSLANAESPDIRLSIDNVPLDGALLVGQYMDRQYRADSGRVENGVLVFQRAEPYPYGHYYAYFSSGVGLQLLVSEDQTFSMIGDMANLVSTMQVEGSQDNELLYTALRYEQDLQAKFQDINNRRTAATPGSAQYQAATQNRADLVAQRGDYLEQLFQKAPNSLFTSFKRAGQNPEIRDISLADGTPDEQAQVADFRYRFWDNVDFSDARLLRTPVIKNKLDRYIKELTPQNADSLNAAADRLLARTNYRGKFFEFFANWITLQYEPGKSPVMDAEAIHVNMIKNYFTKDRATWSDSMTVYGLQQRAETMAHSLIGQQAPDITVPGLDGQGKRLYDLKKPYLAVFMYNPECDHCIEQTPKLTALYPKLRNQLDIYAIALDTEKEKWQNFVSAYGMQSWTNVFDPTNRSIFKTFYVDNTPELYLIDSDRKIVAKNLKVSQLEEAIRLDMAKK